MFKSLITKIKGVLNKMGLIKNIKSVNSLADIPLTDDFYNFIENVWRPLYQGYLEMYDGQPFHKVIYKAISGQRTRKMNTLRMPKIAAEEMARLIFNEKCEINISDESLSENVKNVLDDNHFYKLFQDYLEFMFALGGMAVKVYAEKDRTGEMRLKLSYVTADCFVPTSYSNENISEGVFVDTFRKGKKYFTLLEWHRWEGRLYVIENQLYSSDTENELGILIPLDTIYPDLEDRVEVKNLSRPLFSYFKPNLANNFDMQNPLGISLFANVLDTLKAIDVTFDSFIREFRLGKKKIIVPATAVKTVVDPKDGTLHRYFDPDDETYEAFNFEQMDNQQIQDISVELRVDEHVSAIQAFLDLFAMQIGFTAGTFTFDGQGVKTATEVISENSKTFRTKNSHETIIEEGIKNLITSICEVAELYKIFSTPEKYEVTIDFDDSIAEDRNANADYYVKLLTAGVISKEYFLEKVLDFTPEQASEMVAKVNEEAAKRTPVSPDVIDFIGAE